MNQDIQRICLPMIFNLGSVNCYLVKTEAGFILVDTGLPAVRAALERQLEGSGCHPGDLKLIVITHGDFDHTGSAAYLRRKYRVKIAMHPGDVGMAEQADMFWNRKNPNRLIGRMVPFFFGFKKSDRFTPDVAIREGDDLSAYGWRAQILEIPGHSRGSVGILTPKGDLICGDFLMNDKANPTLGFGDPADFQASLKRVRNLKIDRVYPGHGQPFSSDGIPQPG